jgi:hypothetical protein
MNLNREREVARRDIVHPLEGKIVVIITDTMREGHTQCGGNMTVTTDRTTEEGIMNRDRGGVTNMIEDIGRDSLVFYAINGSLELSQHDHEARCRKSQIVLRMLSRDYISTSL